MSIYQQMQLKQTFLFKNEEIEISYPDCDIIKFYIMFATIYLFDYNVGYVDKEGIHTNIDYNFGLWNDDYDDYSIVIHRDAFNRYAVDCRDEDMQGVNKGTYIKLKKEYVSFLTLYEICKSLKDIIEIQLKMPKGEENYFWKLEKASTAQEAYDLLRQGLN